MPQYLPQVSQRYHHRRILLVGGALTALVVMLLTLGGANLLERMVLEQAEQTGLGGLKPVPQPIHVGEPAPDFQAITPDGVPVALRDYRGSVVALNFWATWCVPCRTEMPALQTASQSFADGELVILAVNAGESRRNVQSYVTELGFTFPALLDPGGAIADLYGIHQLPTTIWIDAEGNIHTRHVGPLTGNQIESYLLKLLETTNRRQDSGR